MRRARVINLETKPLNTKQLQNKIKEKIKYAYVNQYIQPNIDNYKLKTLKYMLRTTSMNNDLQMKYIISTMLVQIAADTHENVPQKNPENETEDQRTYRQLAVLAGDYFSGLFYLALSHIKDIHFIQILADTVKELNELKMKRYFGEFSSFREFLYIERQIESLLFVKIAEFFNIPYFQRILSPLLFINKLFRDKKQLIHGRADFMKEELKAEFGISESYLAREKLNQLIDEEIETLKKELECLPLKYKEKYSIFVDRLLQDHQTKTF